AWNAYCRLSGRPHAYLRTGRRPKLIELAIICPEGFSLPPPVLESLRSLIAPAVHEDDLMIVARHAVRVSMHDLSVACELIQPALDLVLEHMVQAPSSNIRFFQK